MAGYYVYLLAIDGTIQSRRDIDEPSDFAAIEVARKELRKQPTLGGVELWQGARLIFREVRSLLP